MAAISICLINQKGGCGKSSTCFHLAGAFAAAGHTVILIDADPQGSLSQGFLGSSFVENLPANQTLAALFVEARQFLNYRQLVRETSVPGIAIIPANQYLAEFNVPRPERTRMMQFVLRDLLEQQVEYDVVLIDCPPNLYQCTWNALLATENILIPVNPEDFGAQGLRAVHQAIDHARRLNPALRRLGHLITRYDRRLLIHRSYEEQLREMYPHLVLQTAIYELNAYKVALACRKPVENYQAKSTAAIVMRELVEEIFSRLASKAEHRKAG